MTIAFATGLPLRLPHHVENTCMRSRRPRLVIRAATSKASKSAKIEASSLKNTLLKALAPMKRGIFIDPDEDPTDEELRIEQLVDLLESINDCSSPTQSPLIDGRWKLIYTSSSLTRFFGGVTGLQRLLPEGRIGEIVQEIRTEDGLMVFEEEVIFELPVMGVIKWVVSVEGDLRSSSSTRHIWEAETVRLGSLKWFADGWKTVRAFQISDITYLDNTLRITRGQTGSIAIFQQIERQ